MNNIQQVAKQAGVHPNTIRKAIRFGRSLPTKTGPGRVYLWDDTATQAIVQHYVDNPPHNTKPIVDTLNGHRASIPDAMTPAQRLSHMMDTMESIQKKVDYLISIHQSGG